jgi:hypothetical protein
MSFICPSHRHSSSRILVRAGDNLVSSEHVSTAAWGFLKYERNRLFIMCFKCSFVYRKWADFSSEFIFILVPNFWRCFLIRTKCVRACSHSYIRISEFGYDVYYAFGI